MKDVTGRALRTDWVHETVHKGRLMRINRQVIYVSKIARVYERLGGNIPLKITVLYDDSIIESGHYDLNGAKGIVKKYAGSQLEITVNSKIRTIKIKIIGLTCEKS